jgi:hypothetical protein
MEVADGKVLEKEEQFKILIQKKILSVQDKNEKVFLAQRV